MGGSIGIQAIRTYVWVWVRVMGAKNGCMSVVTFVCGLFHQQPNLAFLFNIYTVYIFVLVVISFEH